MNPRQERALELMRAPPKSIGYNRRDLYEGASRSIGGKGCGLYWITYTAGHQYEPLTQQDIDDLVACGLIKQKWPGCYELGKKEGGQP